jgi:hypothetical protein
MSVESVQRARPHFDPDTRLETAPRRPAQAPRHAAVTAEPSSLARQVRAATPAAATPPTEAEIQTRMNAQLEKMGGPYRVDGKELGVPAGFRMNGGMGQLSPSEYVAKLRKALSAGTFKKLAPVIGYVVAGKGTPDQIKRVTQALIDSPAFAQYARSEAGVRQLMWDYGIGADCSGYVHNAFVATRGPSAARRLGLGDPLTSGLQAPPAATFRKVGPETARAGDVMLLVHGDDGTGHKVMVFARHEVPPGTELHTRIAKELGSRGEAKLHLLEVDSSWGAGGDPQNGGVKREVFAYDERSGKWGTLVKDSRGQWRAFASSKSGPYDHDLQGIYRPRSEP